MADPTVADSIPLNPNSINTDFDALPIPPLDTTYFSEDLTLPHTLMSFEDDVVDFDFTFDDLFLPSDTEDFLNSTFPGCDPVQILSDPESGCTNPAISEPELCSGDQSSSVARVSDNRSSDVAGFLNSPSPDSGGFNQECSQDPVRVLNCPSPELGAQNREVSGPASSQGSGNCGSAGSETLNYPSPDSGNCARSVASAPNSGNNDQKIKFEELGNNCMLKRKNENGDVISESRTSKYRRSDADQLCGFDGMNDDEDKRKARLMRNRESAQLSRQRKKHYVEELEDKVRAMHSTIQDLNGKISYIVAENVSMRQQLSGGVVCPPQVPPPGMYPHPPMAPMAYPWMPCPPYLVKSLGSQVPLVPIPRLKQQKPVTTSTSKAKKVESKKTEGKTKKVASVSFLGLLFFIMFFGGLVPMVNVKYRGMQDAFPAGAEYIGNRFNDQHRGSVLTVNSNLNGTHHNTGIGFSNEKFGAGKDFTNTLHCGRNHGGGAELSIEQKELGSHPLPSSDEFVHLGNASEPLVASLYVPRNDKLVKIDGNLIIHSVLASEKAGASREDPGMKSGRETGLAIALNLASAVPGMGRNKGRQPHLYRRASEQQRALASGSADKDNLKSTAADGKLQQWFREGLAGPLLSSGMCTEVFQFDVSPASAPGVIATSVQNISAEHSQNSTRLSKGRNRRILHGLPIPLPGSVHNITKEHVGSNSQKEKSHTNNSLSSMVVSVLVDPREAGDGDGDGMMGTKSLSRIFVVVLLDSVKYVTYSCMLPLMGSSPHLVTT